MSWMNTQVIFLECAGGEQYAPGYAVARKTERDAVLADQNSYMNGDCNFPVILLK